MKVNCPAANYQRSSVCAENSVNDFKVSYYYRTTLTDHESGDDSLTSIQTMLYVK